MSFGPKRNTIRSSPKLTEIEDVEFVLDCTMTELTCPLLVSPRYYVVKIFRVVFGEFGAFFVPPKPNT